MRISSAHPSGSLGRRDDPSKFSGLLTLVKVGLHVSFGYFTALTWTDHSPEKGDLSTWPAKPTLNTERWRYETIRACQDALAQPASEYDPRRKLKVGFESSLDSIAKALSEIIGRVSDVDDTTAQTLETIARKAAQTCLEFGKQRCRILVDMSGSNMELPLLERVRQVQEGSREFVVVPRLWRVGNSEGQNFEKRMVIPGCEGTTEPVVYRELSTLHGQ